MKSLGHYGKFGGSKNYYLMKIHYRSYRFNLGGLNRLNNP